MTLPTLIKNTLVTLAYTCRQQAQRRRRADAVDRESVRETLRAAGMVADLVKHRGEAEGVMS